MRYPVVLTHPTTGAKALVEQGSSQYRRMRLAGWVPAFQPARPEAPAASAAPTPPAPMPYPDLDPEADLSEED